MAIYPPQDHSFACREITLRTSSSTNIYVSTQAHVRIHFHPSQIPTDRVREGACAVCMYRRGANVRKFLSDGNIMTRDSSRARASVSIHYMRKADYCVQYECVYLLWVGRMIERIGVALTRVTMTISQAAVVGSLPETRKSIGQFSCWCIQC